MLGGSINARDLKRARCHHTTAETEARNVEHLGLGVPISVIPNGVDVPEVHPDVATRVARRSNEMAAENGAFFGSNSSKKGPADVDRGVGTGAAERLAFADRRGRMKPGTARNWKMPCLPPVSARSFLLLGPIEGEKKQSVFSNANLFVLPTHSENFGIVVAEALAHGLPVLTTTGAPWSMLSERDCGWWVDATVDGIAEGLAPSNIMRSRDASRDGYEGSRVGSDRIWMGAHRAEILSDLRKNYLQKNDFDGDASRQRVLLNPDIYDWSLF